MKLETYKEEHEQENIVIEYLLGLNDEFVNKAIDNCPDKDFSKCWFYITNEARKTTKSNCAMVKDETVYQWAKDYYIDYDLRKKQEEEQKKNEAKKKAELEKNEVIKNSKEYLNKMRVEITKGHNIGETGLTYLELNSLYEKCENGSISKDEVKRIEECYRVYNDQYVNIPIEKSELSEKIEERTKKVVEKHQKEEKKKEEPKGYQQTTLFDFI